MIGAGPYHTAIRGHCKAIIQGLFGISCNNIISLLTAVHGELDDLRDLAAVRGNPLSTGRVLLVAVLHQVFGRYIQCTVGIFVAVTDKALDGISYGELLKKNHYTTLYIKKFIF